MKPIGEPSLKLLVSVVLNRQSIWSIQSSNGDRRHNREQTVEQSSAKQACASCSLSSGSFLLLERSPL